MMGDQEEGVTKEGKEGRLVSVCVLLIQCLMSYREKGILVLPSRGRHQGRGREWDCCHGLLPTLTHRDRSCDPLANT